MSNSKGSKVFFPSEFSKLAESFTNSTRPDYHNKGSSKGAEYYKELLKNYVDSAVKKAKQSGKEDSKGKKKK
jgi:hypothetical protein